MTRPLAPALSHMHIAGMVKWWYCFPICPPVPVESGPPCVQGLEGNMWDAHPPAYSEKAHFIIFVAIWIDTEEKDKSVQGSAAARGDLLCGTRLLQSLYLAAQASGVLAESAFYCDAVTGGTNWFEEYWLWVKSRVRSCTGRGMIQVQGSCRCSFAWISAAAATTLTFT